MAFEIENGVLTDYTEEEGVTEVVIPENVTSIREYAFDGCSSLKSITIPDSVISIGYGAFADCKSLTSIIIPDGVTSIRECTFEGCKSITGIIIPNSVTSIEDAAFSGCSSLTSIAIPDSVTSIGGAAFADCSSLISIIIPDSVISIEEDTFTRCSSLTSVAIPNSVTSIGEFAFSDCSSLTKVIIPNKNVKIEDYAFPDSVEVIIGRASTSVEQERFDEFSDNESPKSQSIFKTEIIKDFTMHIPAETKFIPEDDENYASLDEYKSEDDFKLENIKIIKLFDLYNKDDILEQNLHLKSEASELLGGLINGDSYTMQIQGLDIGVNIVYECANDRNYYAGIAVGIDEELDTMAMAAILVYKNDVLVNGMLLRCSLPLSDGPTDEELENDDMEAYKDRVTIDIDAVIKTLQELLGKIEYKNFGFVKTHGEIAPIENESFVNAIKNAIITCAAQRRFKITQIAHLAANNFIDNLKVTFGTSTEDMEETPVDRNLNGVITHEDTEVIINDDLALILPEGYIYTTDPDITKQSPMLREDEIPDIIILRNDASADFNNLFWGVSLQIRISHLNKFSDGSRLLSPFSMKMFFEANFDFSRILFWGPELMICYTDGFFYLSGYIFTKTDMYLFHVCPNQDEYATEDRKKEMEREVLRIIQTAHQKSGCYNGFSATLLNEMSEILQRTTPDSEDIYGFYTQAENTNQGLLNVVRNMGPNLRDNPEYRFESIAPASDFPLAETAWQYSMIFRCDVQGEPFDEERNRQTEIQTCIVRTPQLLHTLRSFAWCVEEYCSQIGKQYEDLELNELLSICQWVESCKGLCYRENDTYSALCNIQDSNFAYVTDPESFYNSHVDACGDLLKLREELTKLEPLMEVLKDFLQDFRITKDIPLDCAAADVLYTWCSMTLAATHCFIHNGTLMGYNDEPKNGSFKEFKMYQADFDEEF